MARTRARKKHKQLTLADARKELGRGGWRRCGGRKRKPGSISHDSRPQLHAQHPQHTAVRLVDGAPNLARAYLMKIIRKVLAESHKQDFRIVEFNVLGNHLHLINEAAGKESLARGMQGLEVRLAKRLNAVLKRKGNCSPIAITRARCARRARHSTRSATYC
jgi:REP element-mobilizing transposase RayT